MKKSLEAVHALDNKVSRNFRRINVLALISKCVKLQHLVQNEIQSGQKGIPKLFAQK